MHCISLLLLFYKQSRLDNVCQLTIQLWGTNCEISLPPNNLSCAACTEVCIEVIPFSMFCTVLKCISNSSAKAV